MTGRLLMAALAVALAGGVVPAPAALAQTEKPCPSEVRFEEGQNIRGWCRVAHPPQPPVPERRKAGTIGTGPGVKWTYDPDTEVLEWYGTTVDDNHIPRQPTRRTVVHNVEFIEEDDDRLFLHVQPSTVNRPTGRTFAEFGMADGNRLRIIDASGSVLPRGNQLEFAVGTPWGVATTGQTTTITAPANSDVADLVTWFGTQSDLSATYRGAHSESLPGTSHSERIRREMAPEPAFRIGPSPGVTIEGNWTIEIGARGKWNAQIPGSKITRERRHRFSSRYITFAGSGCDQADYGEVGGYHDRIRVRVWNYSKEYNRAASLRGIRPEGCVLNDQGDWVKP